MLPKQTKEMLTLRETFGMYNFSIYEECVRHSQNTNKVMANYLREFLDDQFKISITATMILE
jgi:CRISPR/Cas system-associated protein endoribonuclease Cas2